MYKLLLICVFVIVAIASPSYGQDVLLTSDNENESSTLLISNNEKLDISMFNYRSSWIHKSYTYGNATRHQYSFNIKSAWILSFYTNDNDVYLKVFWSGSGSPFFEGKVNKKNSVLISEYGSGILNIEIYKPILLNKISGGFQLSIK